MRRGLIIIALGALGATAITVLLIKKPHLTVYEPMYPAQRSIPRERRVVLQMDLFQKPAFVDGWDDRSLMLTDGRRVRISGFAHLPTPSSALTEIAKHSVEVGADGRVQGLVPVWYWCGEQLVRRHLVRVDLPRLLVFIGEGQPVRGWSSPCALAHRPLRDRSGEHGWNSDDYQAFLEWNGCMDRADRLFGLATVVAVSSTPAPVPSVTIEVIPAAADAIPSYRITYLHRGWERLELWDLERSRTSVIVDGVEFRQRRGVLASCLGGCPAVYSGQVHTFTISLEYFMAPIGMLQADQKAGPKGLTLIAGKHRVRFKVNGAMSNEVQFEWHP